MRLFVPERMKGGGEQREEKKKESYAERPKRT
jgi:hypothetical protein